MRWAAAWAEIVVDCCVLVRLREATGLSDAEPWDQVRVAIGSWVGE